MARRSYGDIQRQSVSKDRIITDYPKAFNPEVTPYRRINFSPKVQDAVTQSLGLKVVKVVLVGEVAAGKTCLVQRFCKDYFDRDYKATIGVDFEVERFNVLSIPFSLQIWDTAGQERFKSIAASYYRSANAVVVVFDFSNVQSLQMAKQWKEDACSNVEIQDPLVFLIGSKKDLVSESAYKSMESRAIDLAQEIGAEFWPVSSKTGENVQNCFFRITALLFENSVLREIQPKDKSSKKIGSNLIKVEKEDTNDGGWSKAKDKLKCCN